MASIGGAAVACGTARASAVNQVRNASPSRSVELSAFGPKNSPTVWPRTARPTALSTLGTPILTGPHSGLPAIAAHPPGTAATVPRQTQLTGLHSARFARAAVRSFLATSASFGRATTVRLPVNRFGSPFASRAASTMSGQGAVTTQASSPTSAPVTPSRRIAVAAAGSGDAVTPNADSTRAQAASGASAHTRRTGPRGDGARDPPP